MKWGNFDEASTTLDNACQHMNRSDFQLKLRVDIVKLQAQVIILYLSTDLINAALCDISIDCVIVISGCHGDRISRKRFRSGEICYEVTSCG